MWSHRVLQRACRAALLLAAVLAARPAAAQGETSATAAVSAAEVYDGNLFATPDARGPQADFITRVGLLLEAGYRAEPLSAGLRYMVEGERYAKHVELDRNVARQDAGLAVRFAPAPRLVLTVDARFMSTHTPSELNIDSQLAVGRRRAERLSAAAAAAYNWSEVTSLSVEHAFTGDHLEGSGASRTRDSVASIERHVADERRYRFTYRHRDTAFEGAASETSHVATAGWVRPVTERTHLEIDAGTCAAAGGFRPELSGLVRRTLRRGSLSAGYARTQVSAIGERGMFDVQRLMASMAYRPAPGISVTATPSVARSRRGSVRMVVSSLDLEAALEPWRSTALLIKGRIGRQRGTPSSPDDVIAGQTLAVQLVMALAPRALAPRAPVE